MARPRAQSAPTSGVRSEAPPYTQQVEAPSILPEKVECMSPVEDLSMASSLPIDMEHQLPPSPDTTKRTWMIALAPLILHFLCVATIILFIAFYISNRNFNIEFRKPLINQPDNTTRTATQFTPTQSDVTTFLSSALVVLRTFAGLWCGATVWRCMFVLLEKEGITLQQIKRMLSMGIPPLPRSRCRGSGSYTMTPSAILVAIILLLAIPYQFSSPILTGSITWSASSVFVPSIVPLSGVPMSGAGDHWRAYCMWIEGFTSQVTSASGLASMAWGANGDTSMTKRVVKATQYLPVNSSLNNVTLPYFNIKSLEWVKDPIANQSDKVLLDTFKLDFNPLGNVTTTTVAILQDAWELDEMRQFPEPTVIEETRLMAFVYDHPAGDRTECYSSIFGPLPDHIGAYRKPINTDFTCYLLAYVTYQAGAATCTNCMVTSPGLVEAPRKDLSIKPDPMAYETMLLMAATSTSMALMNVSLPQPWMNVEEYTRAMLVRSYEASWNSLSTLLAAEPPELLQTDVMLSVPMSRAVVESSRVCIWLLLNLFLTLSGVLFVFVQLGCKRGLVLDTSMAALLLDMTDVLHRGPPGIAEKSKLGRKESDSVGMVRLCERKGSHSIVVMDRI